MKINNFKKYKAANNKCKLNINFTDINSNFTYYYSN